MPLPISPNAISLSQIAGEFSASINPPARSISEFRSGAGIVPAGTVGFPNGVSTAIPSSGVISFSNFHGASNTFFHTISANVQSLDLRTGLVNAGWNQTAAVDVTINSGVWITDVFFNKQGALIISGSYPAGLIIRVNGIIAGVGGFGANRRGVPSAGGPAVRLASSVGSSQVQFVMGSQGGILGGGGGGAAFWAGGGGGAGGGRGGITELPGAKASTPVKTVAGGSVVSGLTAPSLGGTGDRYQWYGGEFGTTINYDIKAGDGGSWNLGSSSPLQLSSRYPGGAGGSWYSDGTFADRSQAYPGWVGGIGGRFDPDFSSYSVGAYSIGSDGFGGLAPYPYHTGGGGGGSWGRKGGDAVAWATSLSGGYLFGSPGSPGGYAVSVAPGVNLTVSGQSGRLFGGIAYNIA